MKWWSRWVTLPHQLACRASALLVCHDPVKIGKPPWCCPRQAEFWGLGCTAGARLVRKLACRAVALAITRKSVSALCASTRQPSAFAILRAKAGAVAGSRTRTCSVAGSHSAVKSQPRKLIGPEVSLHFRPMPFQQRTNTSWRSIRSQPAVSRRLFRCLGAHLLRSP